MSVILRENGGQNAAGSQGLHNRGTGSGEYFLDPPSLLYLFSRHSSLPAAMHKITLAKFWERIQQETCKKLPGHNRKLLQYQIALLLGPHICFLVLSPTPVLVKVDLLIPAFLTLLPFQKPCHCALGFSSACLIFFFFKLLVSELL